MEGEYLYLGRNSVTMDRFGGRVTAPIKRTTFGWRSLRIIRTLNSKSNIRYTRKVISNHENINISSTNRITSIFYPHWHFCYQHNNFEQHSELTTSSTIKFLAFSILVQWIKCLAAEKTDSHVITVQGF